MSSIALFLRPRFIPLIVMLLISSVVDCGAVTMDVSVGFDGVMKARSWTPVAVRLANTDSGPVDGKLVAWQKDNNKPLPICAARVTLPQNSKKLYYVYTKAGEYGGNVGVSLSGAGLFALQKTATATVAGLMDTLVVTVGPRSARLNFLNGETISKTNPNPTPWPPGGPTPAAGPVSSRIYVGSITPEDLPDRPAAYDGVDVIVLSDFSPASASPRALKALSMWTASGGTLIVSTGADYRRFQNEFYGDLLPVKVTGVATLPSLDSLSGIGQSPFPPGAMAVSVSAVKPEVATTLDSQNGIPTVVTRRYGAGEVVFLACDYQAASFRDWSGQAAFWKSLMQGHDPSPLVCSSASLAEDAVGQYGGYQNWNSPETWGLTLLLGQNPEIGMPSFNAILLFLLIYVVCLAPVNYGILKRKKKMQLAWLTTPLIVIVFTLGAYGMGYTMKGGRLLLREATFVETSSNARYARAITDASLFSPARKTYSVEASDPCALVQAVVAGNEKSQPPVAYIGDRSTIEDVSMAMWSSKAFESVSGVDLGGTLEADLTLKGDVLSGSIRNSTGIDFHRCSVVFGSSVTPVGDLSRGQSHRINAQWVLVNPGASPGSMGWNPYDQQNGVSIASSLPKFSETVVGAANVPVLLAYADAGDGVFRPTGRRAKTERAVVYAFRLDYRQVGLPAGQAFTRDGFNYSDGMLAGRNGWSGNATSEIKVVNGAVVISGGSPVVEVTRMFPPGAPRGTMGVRIKAKAGVAKGTMMWDVYINDAAGRNFARWYGDGNSCRGRIGGSSSDVTPPHMLTGGWDELRVLIRPAAHTATFYVNGQVLGMLNYQSTGATGEAAKVKLGRLNNPAAAGGSIYLDDLEIR